MTFKDRLKSLGFDSYNAYLRGEHWKSFKSSYRASGHPMRCAVCGGKKIQLHHHDYSRLGAEVFTDIDPLCGDHHEEVHLILRNNGWRVDQTAKVIYQIRKQISDGKKEVQAASNAKRRCNKCRKKLPLDLFIRACRVCRGCMPKPQTPANPVLIAKNNVVRKYCKCGRRLKNGSPNYSSGTCPQCLGAPARPPKVKKPKPPKGNRTCERCKLHRKANQFGFHLTICATCVKREPFGKIEEPNDFDDALLELRAIAAGFRRRRM